MGEDWKNRNATKNHIENNIQTNIQLAAPAPAPVATIPAPPARQMQRNPVAPEIITDPASGRRYSRELTLTGAK
jgi:hypothetical protein